MWGIRSSRLLPWVQVQQRPLLWWQQPEWHLLHWARMQQQGRSQRGILRCRIWHLLHKSVFLHCVCVVAIYFFKFQHQSAVVECQMRIALISTGLNSWRVHAKPPFVLAVTTFARYSAIMRTWMFLKKHRFFKKIFQGNMLYKYGKEDTRGDFHKAIVATW